MCIRDSPDKSHADEMLAFAEQAGREYEAELSGQSSSPVPITSPHARKNAGIGVENGLKNRLWRLFREPPL